MIEPINIVLVEPEIPPNTGNVARTCAVTGSVLHLVEPLGFEITDARLKRAGLDYWQHLKWRRWSSWNDFEAGLPPGARVWFVESNGPRRYTEARFEPGDFIVFGKETKGLPLNLVKRHEERWLRLPMFNPDVRSLNLSNCVAVVLYEALRQLGFEGER